MSWLLLLACSGPGAVGTGVDVTPVAIGEAECAVCGMMVGEQPSPRGQLTYRDGSRDFVCSIEELRAMAQQRTAKGHPVGVFVEALPVSFEPETNSSVQQPWVPASEAWFVFGTTRQGVMGEPVLSFTTEETAAAFAERVHTTPVDWAALESAPFHTIPAGAGVRNP